MSSNEDLDGVSLPYNDALVVSLLFEDYKVIRIFIDIGSAVNVIFLYTLKRMNIRLGRMVPTKTVMVGFTSELSTPIGTIMLLVAFGSRKL